MVRVLVLVASLLSWRLGRVGELLFLLVRCFCWVVVWMLDVVVSLVWRRWSFFCSWIGVVLLFVVCVVLLLVLCCCLCWCARCCSFVLVALGVLLFVCWCGFFVWCLLLSCCFCRGSGERRGVFLKAVRSICV